MTTRVEPLTRLQQACAGIIAELWAANGRSPTLAELQHELDLASVHEVRHVLLQLETKGWLERQQPGQPLSFRLRVREVPIATERSFDITDAGRAAMAAHGTSQGVA